MSNDEDVSSLKHSGQNYWNSLRPKEGDLVGVAFRSPTGDPVDPIPVNVFDSVYALDQAFAPVFLGALHGYRNASGANPDLVLITLLAASASVVQSVAGFKLDGKERSSAGLSTVFCGGSGIGKSTVAADIYSPIFEFEKRLASQAHAENDKQSDAVSFWNAADARFKRAIPKCRVNGEDDSVLLARYEAHKLSKPAVRRPPTITISNGTPEGITEVVASNPCGVTVVNSEGAQFLRGRGSAGFSVYTSLLSGESYKDMLAGIPDGRSVYDPRFSMCISVQNEFFSEFTLSPKVKPRAIGYFGRTIVCRARNHSFPSRVQLTDMNGEDFDIWKARVVQILERGYSNHPKPVPLEYFDLSPEANEYLEKIDNQIKNARRKDGRYEKAQDHASRLMEMIMRVTVIIHVIEGGVGAISIDVLDVACVLCRCASGEFLSLFHSLPNIDELAQMMLVHLDKYRPKRFISTSYYINKPPTPCRLENYWPTLRRLEELEKIQVIRHAGSQYIDLEPGCPILDGELFWDTYAIKSDK